MTKEEKYNESISESCLGIQEKINPNEMTLLTYSGPRDTCMNIESGKLGNMAGGFHFQLCGVKWYSTEHLYLCGEWSENNDKCIEIQDYIRKMASGVYAKRCSKAKFRNLVREDFISFRFQWMLYCVWQKCILNNEFAELLKSIPSDMIIVEVVKNDSVWAAYPNSEGMIEGGNAMGKILTICRRCLLENKEPNIDKGILNNAGIYILGNRISF